MFNFFNNSLNLSPDEVLDYLRKSRTDDPSLTVEEVLAKHETILDEWAVKNLGGVVPDENKFKEVVSGETIADRPEFLKLLKLIESPKIKAILTVEVQRLSRGDLEDAGKLIKLLRYTNTLVITPTMIYDLSNEYSRDMFERELKRGNEFLEYQKKIMNRGLMLSVQQGNFVGSIAPYGYEKILVEDGKRKCPTLKIKEDEAEVVRMIFDMYVNEDLGRSLICRRLDELAIKPPKGKKWSPHALPGILENVHYIGKIKWNWRKSVTVVEDSNLIKTRPRASADDYLIFEGKHQAIISEELFYAAQEKKGKNHRAKPDTKLRNPLAGLIFCQCGRAMTYRTYRKHGKEYSSPRLLCNDQVNCNTSSCTYDEVIEQVIATLKECIADFEVKINQDNKDAYTAHLRVIKLLEDKLAALEKKELGYWDKYTEEQMPKDIFDKLNAAVLKDKEETKEALYKARASVPDPKIYEKQLYSFRDALEALQDSDVPVEKQNRLLKACIERIDYNRPKCVMMKNANLKTPGAPWNSPPLELNIKLRV